MKHPMPASYTLSAHLPGLIETWAPGREMTAQYFALVDAGQLSPTNQALLTVQGQGRAVRLYEGVAENVLHLSPLVIELAGSRPGNSARMREEILQLDAASRDRPALSLLLTPLDMSALLRHLRTLLRLLADGDPYLWRLADTQMALAMSAALTDEQAEVVFGPLHGWWFTGHNGLLRDLGRGSAANAVVASSPLILESFQLDLLMDAARAPMLAAQIRKLEPAFSQWGSHAEQVGFAAQCLEDAKNVLMDEDAELVVWSLSRWRERQAPAAELAEGTVLTQPLVLPHERRARTDGTSCKKTAPVLRLDESRPRGAHDVGVGRV